MEIGLDLISGLKHGLGIGREGAAAAGNDWHGLRARLAASHAARCALVRGEAGPARPAGAFARLGEPFVGSTGQGAWRVNLGDSTHGKPLAGIVVDTAGQPDPAVEE